MDIEQDRRTLLLEEARNLTKLIRDRSNADRESGLPEISDVTYELNQRDSKRASAIMAELSVVKPVKVIAEENYFSAAAYLNGSDDQRKVMIKYKAGIKSFQNLDLRAASESLIQSAQASFLDFEVVPGVREVLLKDLGELLGGYNTDREEKRILNLADAIRESGEIEPVFVGLPADGSIYIMEGQHRVRALALLGYTSIPARLVVDLDEIKPSTEISPKRMNVRM